ncbi:MAG: hypothetical protein HYX34_11665 [Actinobacteria bacterium]|nr:hypothetical protein [Actinomycetota bacterium]
MAAPEYVPQSPTDNARAYSSPPRRPESWVADRPGEVVSSGQPRSLRLGNQGPDQGYVLRLAGHFADRLRLVEGEHRDDVIAGCIGVALKRASLFGRAPVAHDLEAAFGIFGFLDDPARLDPELLGLRQRMFAVVANPHHYREQRAIADAVPEDVLRLPQARILEQARADWRRVLSPVSPPRS